jgi:hypothetical protein
MATRSKKASRDWERGGNLVGTWHVRCDVPTRFLSSVHTTAPPLHSDGRFLTFGREWLEVAEVGPSRPNLNCQSTTPAWFAPTPMEEPTSYRAVQTAGCAQLPPFGSGLAREHERSRIDAPRPPRYFEQNGQICSLDRLLAPRLQTALRPPTRTATSMTIP